MNPVAAQAGPDRSGSDRRTRLMNFPPAGRPMLACEVSKMPPICGLNIERVAEMQTPLRSKDLETPLRGVRTNIVQSIRAFRVQDLQDAATSMGHHFLYANLAHAQSKQDVLDLIAAQFTFPSHFGKNFDALYDCMTDPLHKSGPQPGFIVVLEQIPATGKFDKEAREQLLDIFRDAADYWGDRKIPFRCFYSFL